MQERKARTQSILKTRIVCKGCFTVFTNDSLKIRVRCPNCGKEIDARDRTGYAKIYSDKHPERLIKANDYDKAHKKERGLIQRIRVRKVVLNIISNNNPVCVNCGCDDIRLLEINHINGGGNKELQKGKFSNQYYWDIYMGRRGIEDLNLLCKVCNSLHYHELKYGKLPYKILWGYDV